MASRVSRVRQRSGKVIVIIALSMPIIMGAGAMALDGGLLVSERRHAQSVADASALAAAYVMYNNLAQGQANSPSAASVSTALANGYDNDGVTSIVTTNIPPLSGNFIGKANYVEVIVTYKRTRMFSAIWGKGTNSVSARSVARTSSTSGSPVSVLVLAPSLSGSLSVAGSAGLVAVSGIQVNSNSPTAAIANNTGYAKGSTINIVGGNSVSSGGYFSGPITNGAPAIADPLSALPSPDPSTMTTQGSFPSYGAFTINPGVYNGGATFGGGSVVFMNPGIYYMKGGSFTVANGVAITGPGVMIYVDNGGGALSFQGGGVITLSPPTSGTYAGITYFQDRTSTAPISIANGSTTTISGTFYAAKAPMSYAGGAVVVQSASQLITYSLNLSNNAQVRVGSGSGSVVNHIGMGLVE